MEISRPRRASTVTALLAACLLLARASATAETRRVDRRPEPAVAGRMSACGRRLSGVPGRRQEVPVPAGSTEHAGQTGVLYEQIGPKGQTGDDNVYNSGSFPGAANALHQATHEDGYDQDALLAANHVVSKQPILHHNARLENAWADQCVRAMARFCLDNNPWGRYRSWFEASAEAAWKARCPDRNITWNDWKTATETDDCTSSECVSMAVLFQVMPGPTPPGARGSSSAPFAETRAGRPFPIRTLQ